MRRKGKVPNGDKRPNGDVTPEQKVRPVRLVPEDFFSIVCSRPFVFFFHENQQFLISLYHSFIEKNHTSNVLCCSTVLLLVLMLIF